jgi:exoribonuclease II
MNDAHFDLADRARRAMMQASFLPDFPPEIEPELQTAKRKNAELPVTQDLTALLWSSIDNEESRDLDQVEYAEFAENDGIRFLLGIADVATFVTPDSAIDKRAAHNTVTVYTAGRTFHLLPEELSTQITSLHQGERRLALVVEMIITPDGTVRNPKVYHALIKNQARLTYEQVAAWMSEEAAARAQIESLPGLGTQMSIQIEASRRLMGLRKRMGALTFSSYEAKPVTRDGKVVDLRLVHPNRARELIESFMVATNVATATFLKSRGWPIIERVVHAPRRWDRIRGIAGTYGVKLPATPAPKPLAEFLAVRRAADPEGFRHLSLSIVKLLGPGEYVVEYPTGPQTSHFGLAVDDYSHSTAPNRRFADLILQRLLFAQLAGKEIPYSQRQLERIARHCTEREDAARKIERLMRKVAAAFVLRERIGQNFDAQVTGASEKGTYVRLLRPPAEGRVIRGQRGMDVGDRVKVQLVSIDPERGFIDFEGV